MAVASARLSNLYNWSCVFKVYYATSASRLVEIYIFSIIAKISMSSTIRIAVGYIYVMRNCVYGTYIHRLASQYMLPEIHML